MTPHGGLNPNRLGLGPPWWTHPAVGFCSASGLSALFTYFTPGELYERYWNTWKYFDAGHLALALLCCAAFVFGAWFANRLPRPAGAAPDAALFAFTHKEALLRIFHGAFLLTLAGYVVWFGAAVARGAPADLVLAVFRGDKGAAFEMKEVYMGTVKGITTLTQFGIVVVVLGAILTPAAGLRRTGPACAAVACLAAIRSVLNAERLAMVELAIPALVAALRAWPMFCSRGPVRRAAQWAPLAAPFVLVAGFTLSESIRSWSYYADQGHSLVGFGASRLSGYYVTSMNNGALLTNLFEEPLGVPFFSAPFLYRFPGINVLPRAFLAPAGLDMDADPIRAVFENSANVEFNNPGGLFLPVLDFGPALGIFYWLAGGVVAGGVFVLYRRGEPPGLLLYPLLFLSLLETPRIIYWGEGRAVPAIAVSLAVSFALRGRPAQAVASSVTWDSEGFLGPGQGAAV